MLTKLLGTCFFWAAWTVAFAVLIYKLRRKPKFLIPAIAIMLGIAAIPIVDKLYNPTALDQINPEMVWDVHAMDLPTIKTHEFHGIYFAFDPTAGPIGPGTRLAVMPYGFYDWTDAYIEAIRNHTPPPPGAFVGTPPPYRVMQIDPTGTQLLLNAASSWNWADPSIKLAYTHLATYKESKGLRKVVDPEAKPDWWPEQGDVAQHHTYGFFVPGRPAVYRVVSCTYLGESSGSGLGVMPGIRAKIFTGPHEIIIEDFSTTTPRRIGFNLKGSRSRSISGMTISHDGSVGYTLDYINNRVWLIPLYKAWEYLDSTSPPTTPDSSSHSAQSPSRRAP